MRLLKTLKNCPPITTVPTGLSLRPPQQLDRVGLDYQQVIKAEFEQYADASGEHVCPQMVKDDLDKLKKAAKACEDFADKRIVHQDNRDPKGDPTFDQLDNCIKLLDQTYVKYHLLFYAEGIEHVDANPSIWECQRTDYHGRRF